MFNFQITNPGQALDPNFLKSRPQPTQKNEQKKVSRNLLLFPPEAPIFPDNLPPTGVLPGPGPHHKDLGLDIRLLQPPRPDFSHGGF